MTEITEEELGTEAPGERDTVSHSPAREKAAKRNRQAAFTGASRKRAANRDDRTVVIPPCEDPALRAALEADTVQWLMYVFQDDGESESPFSYPFTSQHLEIIAAIETAIDIGGDQAIAASRGEGKSTITERTVLKNLLTGKIRFAAIFAARGPLATNALEEIKIAIETNPRLLALYPEVCVPVRALENVAQRAGQQLVSGHRIDNGKPFEAEPSDFSWTSDSVSFPKVPGSPSSGSKVATRGLDGAVRGLKKQGRRPDIAIIDDPDDEETARSVEQTKKLHKQIDRAIACLGSQKKPIARVLLTTLQTNSSVSAVFTDPAQKPSWKGKRFKFLVKKPARGDLWEKFVSLWQADQATGTDKAHVFYLANRVAMDDGAEVSNEYRFDPATQVSSLEFYYSQVAKLGQEAVSCEYDNMPPVEAATADAVLTPKRIQRQISGLDRQVIPPETTHITQGIDCKKQALHWAVRAWQPDGSPITVDYGITEVVGTEYGKTDGVELALRRAIVQRYEEFVAAEYRFADGEAATELIEGSLTLIDCRWQRESVVAACREIGDHEKVLPVMGFGKSKGYRGVFRRGKAATATLKPGENYNLTLDSCVIEGRVIRYWSAQADSDYWKNWEHERWLTGEGKAGRALIWGTPDSRSIKFGELSADMRKHFAFAHHITNEVEVDGVFKAKSDTVHWLDASCYSDLAYRVLTTNIRPTSKVIAPANTARPQEGVNNPTVVQPPRRKRQRVTYYD